MVEASSKPSEEETKALQDAAQTEDAALAETDEPAKKKKKRNKKKKGAAAADDLGLDAPEEEKKAEVEPTDDGAEETKGGEGEEG